MKISPSNHLNRVPLYGLLLLAMTLRIHADPDEALQEQMKKNAAEQAAALNQNPGGEADRKSLLDAKMRQPIKAGLAENRTQHPDAQWFGDASMGLFVHWSISSVDGDIDLSWPMIYNMGSGKKVPPLEYWSLADRFKAENYDPIKWLQAAKDAGFEYAVLTAKHHDGYTLWPTETTDLGVRTHLDGRDLVREFVEACRAVGLRVGLYFSGPDWWFNHPYMSFNYRSKSGGNSSLPPIPDRPDFDIHHQPTEIKKMPPEERTRVRGLMKQQLTELLTRYGKIDILWFDGGSGSDITLEEIRALQPGIVINNRGGMPKKDGGIFEGDFFTVEHGDQPTRPPGWWEQLRIWNSTSWGYHKADETSYASAARILRTIARTKGWGGTTMANVGPRPDGTLPPPYYARASEIGAWMKTNGESIHGAQPIPTEAEANVPVTVRGDTWYLHAVSGFKDTIVVRPGPSVSDVASARVLSDGRKVDAQWEDGQISIKFSEPQGDKPHEVIAVNVTRP
jgi:alpha-L-fucosidase